MCRKLSYTALAVCLVVMVPVYGNNVIWDFENGNDHGFALTGLKEGELPEGGVAWTVGQPDQFEGQVPAVEEGCHLVDVNDANGVPIKVLQYGPCNDPFSAAVGDPPYDFTNGRGQSSYLNTYNLNQWGDCLHSAENDQIAISPIVLLDQGAELTVWAFGNSSAGWAQPRMAPELDPNATEGYVTGSGGIAVLSADDGSLLASLLVAAQGGDGNMPGEFNLDLSAFAGQKVIIEAVDAFEGGWGWLVIDEIRITNAIQTDVIWDFENGNDHGFTLWSINPATPADDDPNVAGDESLTGGWEEGNPNNLPEAGVTWTIGPPTMMDGLLPGADPAHARVDANGLLNYSLGKERMTRDHGFLNTYNLNYHGDFVHTQENDQIATSPIVQLYEGAILTATVAASGADHEPILDEPGKGYTDGSGGIAVLSAEDGTLLASMETEGRGGEDDFILDLSAFAGQKVIIEAVDAHEGGWGWMAIDEIRITNAIQTDVIWDFESGNDHGFALTGLKEGELPEGGVAWTVGQPDQFEGQVPAVEEGCHLVDVNDANGVPIKVLQYGPCNDPFGAAVGDPPYDFTNGRGQSSYLNTYNLSQWGDRLHSAENDQIAISPIVLLDQGAQLTVWAFGNKSTGGRMAPEFDPNDAEGYVTNSGGIAVISVADGSLLASLLVAAQGGDGNMPGEFNLDLSAFAGQKVIIEAVDAFEGSWGWLAIDEIRITNALEILSVAEEPIGEI